MKKPLEIVQGEKSLRLNLYIIVAVYLLLLLLVEPLLDYILLAAFEKHSLAMLEHINKLKVIISTTIYSLLAIIPASYAAWFGYRVVASAKLPPVLNSGKVRFPFTVPLITGRMAKMFGVLMIVVALVLIFQLVVHLGNHLFQVGIG